MYYVDVMGWRKEGRYQPPPYEMYPKISMDRGVYRYMGGKMVLSSVYPVKTLASLLLHY
jgi:hypothetical protein